MIKDESVFVFNDYRDYVRAWIEKKPKNGHGQLRKMALQLHLAPVTITQIFRGDRELPAESAPELAKFLQLNSLETRYFIKLVYLSRAGNEALREFHRQELDDLRAQSQQLKNRVPSQVTLTESDLAVFHSSWIYSAIRLLTSIEKFKTPSAIADALELEFDQVSKVMEFLVRTGLCIENGDGSFSMGASRTHLPDESPFVTARQISWRTKAFEKMQKRSKSDLYYTAPMSLALADLPRVRTEILNAIDRINSIVAPSHEEALVCLNIDWFKL